MYIYRENLPPPRNACVAKGSRKSPIKRFLKRSNQFVFNRQCVIIFLLIDALVFYFSVRCKYVKEVGGLKQESCIGADVSWFFRYLEAL